ncbi:hypothetical protein ACI2KR_27370 [Pseudomonas luteola]
MKFAFFVTFYLGLIILLDGKFSSREEIRIGYKDFQVANINLEYPTTTGTADAQASRTSVTLKSKDGSTLIFTVPILSKCKVDFSNTGSNSIRIYEKDVVIKSLFQNEILHMRLNNEFASLLACSDSELISTR